MTTVDPAREQPARPRPDGATVAWASPEDEVAMRLVAARLKSSHPEADPATVDALVVGAFDELRDAKVRTFIPILAERRARARLESPPPEPGPAPES